MGVMSCSRKKCNSILCNTYIEEIGYICNECQNDFKYNMNKFTNSNDSYPKTEIEIHQQLKNFIETEKGVGDFFIEISIEEYFRNRTH